jgi:hypothetical protein
LKLGTGLVEVCSEAADDIKDTYMEEEDDSEWIEGSESLGHEIKDACMTM